MASRKGLPTESYKGVRDFYPEDQAVQNYIFSVMKKTCESFGYLEYGASILEPTDIYTAKGAENEEIVNEQTYTFKDRGDRSVTLRPEMTPTVARMIAAKRKELAFPARWYSIPNLFRYERPQRGRLREHWQLNADIFGVATVDAEVEIISLAAEILRAFGANDSDFEIRVSSRKILDSLFASLNLSEKKAKELRALIDRKAKIADFESQAERIVGKPFSLDSVIPNAEVQELIERLKALGMKNVVFDASLARGFDYYTGIVFEIFDTSPSNNRAMLGGGRYDNLLSIFGVEPIPTVGFGMGDVTMRDFLQTRKLLPNLGKTKLFICTVDTADIPGAQKLAARLRERGLTVAVNLTGKKVGEQIKYAEKHGIPCLVCVGSNEFKTGSYVVKHLPTREEKAATEEKIKDVVDEFLA